MSVWFVLVFTVCVTCGSVNKIVCISLFGSSLSSNGSENVLRRSVVSARVCERASVFSSCRYMCITSVSLYLLSSVCFKWHKCIVKRRTYLEAERTSRQPNANTGVFLWIPRSVDCSDFEHNARNLTLKGTLHEED